jgi:hypothetical protein
MDPLRSQENAQHRIECGVYFAENAHVIDNLRSLRQILHAAEFDFALACREDIATPVGPGSKRQRNQEHRLGGADGDRSQVHRAGPPPAMADQSNQRYAGSAGHLTNERVEHPRERSEEGASDAERPIASMFESCYRHQSRAAWSDRNCVSSIPMYGYSGKDSMMRSTLSRESLLKVAHSELGAPVPSGM